jgi:hypothetical protein
LSKSCGDRDLNGGNSDNFDGGVTPTPAVSESAIGEKKLWFGSCGKSAIGQKKSGNSGTQSMAADGEPDISRLMEKIYGLQTGISELEVDRRQANHSGLRHQQCCNR